LCDAAGFACHFAVAFTAIDRVSIGEVTVNSGYAQTVNANFARRQQQWVDVATQQGAVVENLQFIENAQGIGAWAVDGKDPSRLEIPATLLIPEAAIELTDTQQGISSEATFPAPVVGLVNEILGYILSADRLERQARLNHQFARLDEPLRNKLMQWQLVDHMTAAGQQTPIELKRQLMQMRYFRHPQLGRVYMTLIDFLNHDAEGVPFEVRGDVMAVQGHARTDGELCALYSRADPFNLLNTYGFAGTSFQAYSIALSLWLASGQVLRIGRGYSQFTPAPKGLMMPQVVRQNQGEIVLSHLWLGAKMTPRRPFWSFMALWQQIGRHDGLEVWSAIVRANWLAMLQLIPLVEAIEPSESSAGMMLGNTLHKQMAILAESLLAPGRE
jgi:hypothetical protein